MPSSANRIAVLARYKHPIFHTKDLGNLWDVKNSNTLYTILKRYTQRKLLYRIYRGLYSLIPVEKLNPLLLGIKALHQYGYVSTETVLAEESIISQIIYDITLISSKSIKFKIGKHSYVCRKLQDKFLLNPAGIIEKNEVKTATIERAVADLFYFNPKATLDGRHLINWNKVKSLQKYIGYPLTPHQYASSAS